MAEVWGDARTCLKKCCLQIAGGDCSFPLLKGKKNKETGSLMENISISSYLCTSGGDMAWVCCNYNYSDTQILGTISQKHTPWLEVRHRCCQAYQKQLWYMYDKGRLTNRSLIVFCWGSNLNLFVQIVNIGPVSLNIAKGPTIKCSHTVPLKLEPSCIWGVCVCFYK